MLPVDMADAEAKSDRAQKAPRRRKCKNHLVQLAEMFPDIAYHVAASYGSSEDQIYVMEVNVEGSVIPFCIFFKLLNNNNNNHNSVYGGIIVTRKVTARVHPVHLMNVDWAPGGRQPSDQAFDLGCEW